MTVTAAHTSRRPEAFDRGDAAAPSTLGRALAYLDTNAHLAPTVPDVARAACVTPRALQLAFRRELDTTPLAYLRHRRLVGAREDLLAAEAGGGVTVTVIAARWGYTAARFARLYREAHGELPSQTLRR